MCWIFFWGIKFLLLLFFFCCDVERYRKSLGIFYIEGIAFKIMDFRGLVDWLVGIECLFCVYFRCVLWDLGYREL